MIRQGCRVSAPALLLGLACLIVCWVACSAASTRMDDSDRKPWLDDIESSIQNDIFVGELVNRLRALSEAETGLAQYEVDRYFRKNVPFFHLFGRVSPSPVVSRSVYAGKRGFDFGLGRGFSATQAAKHKMAMQAAEFPSGPGRRRRSLSAAFGH